MRKFDRRVEWVGCSLTGMAWTDALGRTNVIGFNMSGDETVTFQNGDGTHPPALGGRWRQEATIFPVLVRFEPTLAILWSRSIPRTIPSPAELLGVRRCWFLRDTLFHRVI